MRRTLVYTEQDVGIRAEGDASDGFAVFKGQRAGLVVDEIKDGYAVAYRGEDGVAICSEEQVAFGINCA